MPSVIAIASYPLLLLFIWLYTVYASAKFPLPKGKRVLLLIAHPDDEAMFFAPTVMALIRPELGNTLKIVCLSTGNADGLGEVRKKELIKSAEILGLRADDVLILDDPNFPDNPGLTWSPRLLANTLTAWLCPNLAKTPSNAPPKSTIDVLVTFDAHGVSGHPNHSACHAGAVFFVRGIMHGREGWDCPVALYALTSVSRLRKYAWVLDMPLSVVAAMHDVTLGSGWAWKQARKKGAVGGGGKIAAAQRSLARGFGGGGGGGSAAELRRTGAATGNRAALADAGGTGAMDCPTPCLVVSGPLELWTAQRAMVSGHWSQMVWFRWGWIALGRYLLVNDLRRVNID